MRGYAIAIGVTRSHSRIGDADFELHARFVAIGELNAGAFEGSADGIKCARHQIFTALKP